MCVGQEEGENFWCNSNKSNYKLLCGEKERGFDFCGHYKQKSNLSANHSLILSH